VVSLLGYTNKQLSKWPLAALVLAWAVTTGGVSNAGSPSKKPFGVTIQTLTHAADEAADSGDYLTALRLYRQLAEKGDARAQYKVGSMVQDDDLKEAVKWWRLAAAQGYAKAEYALGSAYEDGYGVPKDKNEAMKWYKLAATHGDAEAKSKLERRPPSTVIAKQIKHTGSEFTVENEYLGCRSRENFLHFGRIIKSGDDEASQNFLMANVASGECVIFKKGETLFIERLGPVAPNAILPVTFCARPRGETVCFWTSVLTMIPSKN
jgi:Sel1 repeat